MAVYLGEIGSILLKLIDHNLSQVYKFAFFDGPYSNIKSCNVSTVTPLRKIPLSVGKRGSYQLSTTLRSTKSCNFLLDKQVLTKFNLENS